MNILPIIFNPPVAPTPTSANLTHLNLSSNPTFLP